MRRSTLMIAGGVAGVIMLSTATSATAALMITGKNIKDGSVTSADVRNGSLTGVDVKDGSIAAGDLAPSAKAPGPAGPAGPRGAVGPAGPPGPAAASLSGVLVAVFSNQTCPSGTTWAGSIVGQEYFDFSFGTPTTVISTLSSTWSLEGLRTKQNSSATMTQLTLCRVS